MREKAAAFFRKQKKEQWMLYFLLAAIGVVLLLPTGTKKTGEETEQPQETAARPAGMREHRCRRRWNSAFVTHFPRWTVWAQCTSW